MNVFADDWDVEQSRPGFTWKRKRIAGEMLGVSVYELPPGEKSFPYHLHHGNEELLIVLAGTPTLRGPVEERRLGPGDLAFFPRGREGLHALENHSDEPARVLLLSSKVAPDVTERPEEGLVGVFAGDVPTLGRDAPFEHFFPVESAVRG